ncbi:hypothetical protein QQY24_29860 [Streptomyces sp. TG1A-8]|uniref:hypothetical protein n=1 Tax=Streptomyces sp. TG1A-8 TaxID=3051385 RepID=UPI00265C63A9|nr:hypothetical protein [Streptomyces sp. TG1A-8]MDO0929412.1 hypothetical protein [Streptomyces sp. TG1A-8]
MDIAQIVPQMGDEELAAYRFLITTGGARPDRVASSLGWGAGRTERVLSRLSRMKLARSRAEDRSDWTAVHPDTVRLHYAKPLSGVIDAWQAQLEELRSQLDALSGLCAHDEDGGPGPVVTVEGATDIRDALAVAVRRCTEEVLAVQPLGRGTSALARDVVCRDGEPLAPAVGVRVLLPHLSRYDAEVRECTERIFASGGEVRTTAASLPPLIVFDRSVAFLFDDEDTDRVHRVQHKALVEFMVHMVVSAWATSAVFERTGGNNRLPECLTQETKTAIVQLLAAGYKDEVVAKRLGIGVRTCRKYIAELFGDLGAQSRFQAGWMVRDHMLVAGSAMAGADRGTG